MASAMRGRRPDRRGGGRRRRRRSVRAPTAAPPRERSVAGDEAPDEGGVLGRGVQPDDVERDAGTPIGDRHLADALDVAVVVVEVAHEQHGRVHEPVAPDHVEGEGEPGRDPRAGGERLRPRAAGRLRQRAGAALFGDLEEALQRPELPRRRLRRERLVGDVREEDQPVGAVRAHEALERRVDPGVGVGARCSPTRRGRRCRSTRREATTAARRRRGTRRRTGPTAASARGRGDGQPQHDGRPRSRRPNAARRRAGSWSCRSLLAARRGRRASWRPAARAPGATRRRSRPRGTARAGRRRGRRAPPPGGGRSRRGRPTRAGAGLRAQPGRRRPPRAHAHPPSHERHRDPERGCTEQGEPADDERRLERSRRDPVADCGKLVRPPERRLVGRDLGCRTRVPTRTITGMAVVRGAVEDGAGPRQGDRAPVGRGRHAGRGQARERLGHRRRDDALRGRPGRARRRDAGERTDVVDDPHATRIGRRAP